MLGRLLEQTSLSTTERDAMFELLSEHFDGVSREGFEHDLKNKNWVVLVEREGLLQGFSTLRVYETMFEDEQITVVCSGDTIVSQPARGSTAFPRAWITSVYQLRERFPRGRLIWLLLTSGFRTYRFLPVFWSEFYPRASAATPARWQAMLNQLASELYGESFDVHTGIVRFSQPQTLIHPQDRSPTGRDHDPDIAFFVEHNPDHAAGDELVCIADLDPATLSAAGRRVVYGAAK